MDDELRAAAETADESRVRVLILAHHAESRAQVGLTGPSHLTALQLAALHTAALLAAAG